MRKHFIVPAALCLLAVGCAIEETIAPEPECERVFDYAGAAEWFLSADSLHLEMKRSRGDFVGIVDGNIDASKRTVVRMRGALTAPLGQDSFTIQVDDSLAGILKKIAGECELELSSDSLAIRLYWTKIDDLIWYVGERCY